MSRLRALFLMLLLCGHLFRWDLQQLRMWVDMIQNAAQTTTLVQAVNETLSGERPCPMCFRLTREKTTAQTDDAFVSADQAPSHLLPCPAFQLPIPRCARRELHARFSTPITACLNPPLLPPPIFNS